MFKKLFLLVLAPFAVLMGFLEEASAALPVGVTDAITAAQADGTTLAYALLTLAVAVGVIFWLKRKA